jgi:hypothetical protein
MTREPGSQLSLARGAGPLPNRPDIGIDKDNSLRASHLYNTNQP